MTTEPAAYLISVVDGRGKYEGEKIATVFCPLCGATHKHRGDQLSVRQAPCDAAKSYRITRWRQP